jgi:hypothetical protein
MHVRNAQEIMAVYRNRSAARVSGAVGACATGDLSAASPHA